MAALSGGPEAWAGTPDALARIGAVGGRWLVTGCAGFIGSNLVQALLELDQEVVGLDNFSTGHRRNLAEIERLVGPQRWARFTLVEGDLRSPDDCATAVQGVRYVLHQAALGSVPRSIERPLASHASNVDGFAKLLDAARLAGAERFVYASSSSVYGDSPELPKVEERIGAPLSPYAATKRFDELWADVVARTYALPCVGLRYFNVFGARQDPDGAYAAVIPRWIAALLRGEPVRVHGDGSTSRDFCHVDNAVQANLLAAITPLASPHEAFNIACGERTSLADLFAMLADQVGDVRPGARGARPQHGPFRPGDVRHSLADISKARTLLGYAPTHGLADGLRKAMPWYLGLVQR